MANSLAYKHYLRIINRWPQDILRPEIPFQNALRRRMGRRFSPKSDKAVGPAKLSQDAELQQVNALYSLLENRYSKLYPVSESFLRPKSNPSHYTDLLAELEQAPKRSWLAQRLNKWKGFLRFS